MLTGRKDHFKAIVYNFADQPLTGTMRIWLLDHGRYRVTFGPDADGDDQADSVSLETSMELQRASGVPVNLPPKATTVIEITQVEPMDDIMTRAGPGALTAGHDRRRRHRARAGAQHRRRPGRPLRCRPGKPGRERGRAARP